MREALRLLSVLPHCHGLFPEHVFPVLCVRSVACQLFPVFAPGVGGEGFPEVAGDQAPGQVVQRRGQHIGSAAALDHFAVISPAPDR